MCTAAKDGGCERGVRGGGGVTGRRSGAINSDAANIINGNVLNIKAPADREAASPLRQDGTDELTRVSQGKAQKGEGASFTPHPPRPLPPSAS